MKLFFYSLLVACACSFSLTATEQPAQEPEKTEEVDDMNKLEIIGEDEIVADYEGHWVVYIIVDEKKNLLADYSYRILGDGRWIKRDKIGEELIGTAYIIDGKMFFVPINEKPDANGEIRSIPATSYKKDEIRLASTMQAGMFSLLVKGEHKDLMQKDDILGEWQLYQIGKIEDEKVTRTAPFTLKFDTKGTYQIVNADDSVDTANSGSWEIKGGVLYLLNENKDESALWHNASFFLDGDKLVLNRLNFYVFGEKLQKFANSVLKARR